MLHQALWLNSSESALTSRSSCQGKPETLGIPLRGKKWVIVTQWVRIEKVLVPPDQSLASRSVEKPEGKPGNGSPKPGGSRIQALYGAPK